MKKLIAALLSICILLSLCSVAFAQEQIDYLLIGDSIAYGFGVVNRDEACYGKMVCNTNGYNYHNDAISGYEAKNLYNQITTDESVRKHIEEAEIINISIGGNDIRHDNMMWLILSVAFGNINPITNSVSKFYKNFSKVMAEVKSINPDATILVQTVYNPYGQLFNGAFDKGTDTLNESFYKYLDENPDAYTIVDVKAAFKGEWGIAALDTFHPSGKGNKIIAREILKTLKELGLGEKTEPVILVEPLGEIAYPFYKLYKFFIWLSR